MRKLSAALTALWFLCGSTLAQTCDVAPVAISHQGSVSPNRNQNQLVFIDTRQYPQARCNDGSPAAFVIRRGLNAAASRWVINLQAGSSCSSADSCAKRWRNDTAFGTKPGRLTSSTYYGTPGRPDQGVVDRLMQTNAGLLSPNAANNPDFWDATFVRVLYCSSDMFIGGSPAQGAFTAANPRTWNFNGHAILAAILGTLKTGYSLDTATEILFSGSSSGGVGTYLNAAAAAASAPHARFVAMGDAGFFDPSFAAFNGLTTPTSMQSVLSDSYNLWRGYGDANCDRQAANADQKIYSCRDPSYLLTHGYLRVPTYIVQSNYDVWQLGVIEQAPRCALRRRCGAGAGDAGTAYVQAFAQDLEYKIAAAHAASGVGAVVVQYPIHILTTNAAFTEPAPLSSGTTKTIAELLGAWYRDPCSQSGAAIAVTVAGQR